MTCMPFGQLMDWVLQEKKGQDTVFGVHRPYTADPKNDMTIFTRNLETPVGPAAGPHTQLAQNIIASYYAGARFFELKTVQKMDGAELSACVNKPCILADDEGYNCEWSTELTVPDAMGEYIKAWYPDVKVVAVEPYESQAIGGGYIGRHNIPGLGAGFVPENYNPYIVDAVMAVPSHTANVTAREVLETDAIPASPSAGAVLTAAHQLMAEHPDLKRVVCVFAGQVLYE